MLITISPATSASPDWWSLLGPAATILVALIGWMIVEKFARDRERRSDLRLLLSSVSESIGRIVSDASDFYCLDGRDPKALALSQGLKSKIQTLSEHLTTLRTGGMELDTDQELKALRQQVTGGSFDSLVRPACSPDAQKLHLIALSAEDLTLKIEAEFYRKLISKQRWLTRTPAK